MPGSGTNRTVLSEKTMKSASESSLSAGLLNANEEAKKQDKSKSDKKK